MSTPINPDQEVTADLTTSLVSNPTSGHNRWHPQIAPAIRVRPGEVVALDLRDGLDQVFSADTTDADLRMIDWNIDIPMTGPVFVEGAESGDRLEIEIIRIEPGDIGYTAIIPNFGLLGHRFPKPFLVKWRIESGFARSAELPGIAITGQPFLGLMGVAPSIEHLNKFTARERNLARLQPMVKLPNLVNAVPHDDEVGRFGLRTAPPRETGGNMDIRHLTEGSTLTLPVQAEGALFSAGDTHFAQGDGECGGTAIEISSRAFLRFSLTKANQAKWHARFPTFEFTDWASTGKPRRYFATTGLPIDFQGENAYLDLNLAAEQALSEMIEYLTKVRGYTDQQAYVIASVATHLHISEIVDVPNAIVSALLPLDIFEPHQA